MPYLASALNKLMQLKRVTDKHNLKICSDWGAILAISQQKIAILRHINHISHFLKPFK